MSTSASERDDLRVRSVLAVSARVTEDALRVDLDDGRTIRVPLAWYPRLLHGTPAEREHWRLIGRGEGIHWPELDEDISVEGLLAARPSGESQSSLKRWLTARGSRGAARRSGEADRRVGAGRDAGSLNDRDDMERDQVLAWLTANGSPEGREGMTRYGIPNEHAFGVPMGALKKFAKDIGRSHRLASELWATGCYEARTLAAFIDEPDAVTAAQMDAWAHDFDSWAICDTTCFHLFDRTRFAWDRAEAWATAPQEFVRRAAYALFWALSVHDRKAADDRFLHALDIIENAEPDPRPLVKKAIDMALRATGKRNVPLNRAAVQVAERLAGSGDADRAWIGRHVLRELTSEKVRARIGA